ncbi:hypothetical protein B0O99DRAFT_599138 [Bisporella sp. PMI_857]|nr:hypothetical protein B0O99DRAFT_599138 [Bisporella sp. PMI_857]
MSFPKRGGTHRGGNSGFDPSTMRPKEQDPEASTTPNSTGETTAALSKTLKSITLTKIDKLKTQRASYKAQKNEILRGVDSVEGDQREKVSRLLMGVKELKIPITTGIDLSNIHRWLKQSYVDPSIPPTMLVEFEEELRSQLDMQTQRLDLADLYSQLLREWLSSSSSHSEEASLVEDDASLDGSFEVVEKDRVKQLREKFEAVVFTPLETDKDSIQKYLNALFEGEKGSKALERLRNGVKLMSNLHDKVSPFDEKTLVWSLKGLLNNDLLKDEKKAILEEFLKDDVARGEICDVLNMQHADIKNWSWEVGEEGLPVEPRKQLNGKVRIMMDEDVLQAIFLHYIGMYWSAGLKRNLEEIVRYTGIWKRGTRLPQDEVDKRQYFLGEWRTRNLWNNSVESERQQTYLDDFFLSQLPSNLWEGAGGYDDDEVYTEEASTKKSPKEIKQQLLRQLATELTILLKFVGVSEDWITFFVKFLEAPLNLGPVLDDPSAPPSVRIRKRGVPMAHSLEKFFGELVLFFMDLAVNQEADINLYRFHDDLWVCGKPDRCARAWQSMQRFSDMMGLEFNMRKTGSVYLTANSMKSDDSVVAMLPNGPVSVGFLTLDSVSGEWVIDHAEVDAHVKQLQKQLKGCSSILSWVSTWNSCIGRFFSHTFGEPANCFGRKHVQAIMQTHKKIQQTIFDGKDGNGSSVVDHLKGLIEQRFGIYDVPDAFIFMPEQLGGLGVRNPFISSLLVCDKVYKDPMERMEKFLLDEKKEYEDAKREFQEIGDRGRRKRFHEIFTREYGEHSDLSTIPYAEVDSFFSLEEYICWRESTSAHLHTAYQELMDTPKQKGVVISRKVKDAIEKHAWLQEGLNLAKMDEETKWLLQLYSDELFKRCGDLSMVDKSLMPLGILTILRKNKPCVDKTVDNVEVMMELLSVIPTITLA